MATRREVMETEGFDCKEATELSLNKRKLLLNRRFRELRVPKQRKIYNSPTCKNYFSTPETKRVHKKIKHLFNRRSSYETKVDLTIFLTTLASVERKYDAPGKAKGSIYLCLTRSMINSFVKYTHFYLF